MTSVADEIITAQHHTINEQADTIDRLRAALEEIADLPVGYADMPPDHVIERLVDIARAALEEKA